MQVKTLAVLYSVKSTVCGLESNAKQLFTFERVFTVYIPNFHIYHIGYAPVFSTSQR